jgi:uncharacterized repeat protein (TIGR03803 family)
MKEVQNIIQTKGTSMKNFIVQSSQNSTIRRRSIRSWGIASTLAFATCISLSRPGLIQANDQIIRSFGIPGLSTGGEPQDAPIQGSDGAIYGTTLVGGVHNSGVVFKMNTDGSGYTVLHSFGD